MTNDTNVRRWKWGVPRRALAVPAALALLAGVLLAVPANAQTGRAPAAVSDAWLGFGYDQDPQYYGGGPGAVWTDAAFAQMTQRAGYIRPGLVRVMLNRSWFNPSGVAGSYVWDSVAMRNLFRVLDYYRDTGVNVVTGLWGLSPSVDADPYTAPDTATMQADLVGELLRRGYANIIAHAGVNEPNVITDAKHNKYADWATATANLHTAFAAAELPAGLIGGPDTAEANITEQDGDLGLESVPAANAGTTQTLVWHTPGLTGFTARFYVAPDPSAADWSFQASPDNTHWTAYRSSRGAPTVTVGSDPWFRTDVTSVGAPVAGANYLRLTLPAHAGVERALSAITATVSGGGTVTDRMADLTRTLSHSAGWTHPNGAATNDWWLQSALERPSLVSLQQTHFYDREVDLHSPSGSPEASLATAVGQVKAAQPGVAVVLGETGMKAPKGTDGDKDYSFTLPYEHGVRMADLAVQEARAGLDGAMSWCLDGWDKVQCGMWDHLGTTPAQTALRPWFYTWSLLCRYLPAGSTIYAPAQPADVRVLSAKLPAAGGWTFVLVNRGTAAATVPVTAPTGGPVTLHRYVYSQASAPVDPATGFPVPSGVLTADFDNGHNLSVGADSVAVLTTLP